MYLHRLGKGNTGAGHELCGGSEMEQLRCRLRQQHFLHRNIGPNLKKCADSELELTTTGTEYLYFILTKLQPTSVTAGQKLVSELVAIKLSQFKGCHVVECAARIQDICHRLDCSPGNLEDDLSRLVLLCFDKTGIALFDLKVLGMENELDSNMSTYSWSELLIILTNKFDVLLLTDRWPLLQAGGAYM